MRYKSYMNGDSSMKEVVYRFIVQFVCENMYFPSYREISEGTGLRSISSVKWYIDRLEIDGRLAKADDKTSYPRTHRLVGYKVVKDEDST